MSGIMMRGNPALMKTIQERAAAVSKANGINTQQVIPNVPPQGGAAFSIQNQQKVHESSAPSLKGKGNFDFEKSVQSRIIESLEVLSSSKEYFNALQSLITLYAMGNLTEGVLQKLSHEDLNELRGILSEFKSQLDSF